MTTLRVFLLNPPVSQVFEKKDRPDYPHTGIAYLAASVEQAGYRTGVLDAKLERKSFRQAMEVVFDFAPDVLGLTAMTHQIEDAARFASRYKKARPGTVTVIGGVHVTALPEQTLKQFPQFDFGIAGEGEIAFVQFLRALRSDDKRRLDSVPGLAYRAGGNILYNPFSRIMDINTLPLPAWQYFPGTKTYSLITSRGCPHRCIFCMRALGHVVRERDLSDVIREINGVLRDIKPGKIFFYDETFTGNPARVFDLCRQLVGNNIHKKISWAIVTRVDAVDRNILTAMKTAGCNHIEFGVESGNDSALQRSRKGVTKQQAMEAVKTAKELGYHVECGFILGHPRETLETALETIDFAAKLNPHLIQLGIMVPYPGTEIREMAMEGREEYRLLSSEWRSYNKQLGNALELTSLSRGDLERLQLIGYLRLFVYNRRFADLIRFTIEFRREMVSYCLHVLSKRWRRKPSPGKPCAISPGRTFRYIFDRNII